MYPIFAFYLREDDQICWPTHVGVPCVYKQILIYLCVYVGAIILYT